MAATKNGIKNGGSVFNFDSWHWVTLISLEHETGSETAIVEVLDSGDLKRIDLLQWLRTTKLGGGFVSFEM